MGLAMSKLQAARAALRCTRRGLGPLLITILVLAGLAARACDMPEDYLRDLRPAADGPPTEISVGFGAADVLGVDDPNQQIIIDFYVRLAWTDPRLAHLVGCRFAATDIWFPEIYILNSSQLTQKRRNARNDVGIEDGGTIVWVNRYIGGVSTYHNLRRFPFDDQVFEIEISIPEASTTEVQLVPDYERTWLGEKLNIEGWDFHSISMRVEDHYFPQVQQEVSLAVIGLQAERNSEYYVYRVLLLLVIVVAMSWVIFWVPPGRYEFQIGICATALLTAIAFNFSLSSNLPHVGYLTIMDRLVIWAVLLIFLAAVQALITVQLVLRERTEAALTLDRRARWIFPLMFFGGWAAIIALG